MKVIVDTSVWSEAFRRTGKASAIATELDTLIDDHRVVMLGPIRQELLSGVRSLTVFEQMRKSLRSFPDFGISTAHYESAAEFYNRCRSRGVTGTFIDLLITAVAVAEGFSVFSRDKDFHHLGKFLPFELHEFPAH